MRLIALIPAYNEAGSISATLEALIAQDRTPDLTVVIPNGCTDNTASIATQYIDKLPMVVEELPRLPHRKSQALNIAWKKYAYDADIVVCLDADTVLPTNAMHDWEQEFLDDASVQLLGGSSSKFTMLGGDFLTRLQRAEFSKWTDSSLQRGWTSVLAGTGCAILGQALRDVVKHYQREGPWSYDSQVEDFELTYRIRELGYYCQVSPKVRAYTDSMKTLKSLWGQRMKWQVGTVEDLLSLGFNKLTRLDWLQQAAGLFHASYRIFFFLVMTLSVIMNLFVFQPAWLLLTLLFVVIELRDALRIPHRDKLDLVVALTVIPSEIFANLRAAWFVWAWLSVLISKLTGKRKDRWQMQYAAEGITQ